MPRMANHNISIKTQRAGGLARAKALSKKRRSDIARAAVKARWKQYRAAAKSAA